MITRLDLVVVLGAHNTKHYISSKSVIFPHILLDVHTRQTKLPSGKKAKRKGVASTLLQ